ncbi:histidine phosphatase family protein [Leptospira santarosai]|uniref:histidine phosphatase family protein n=1 Tax=Leptospira santarosai TaxID=28183 RepID=UPI0024AF4C64|nr:histidine phosphatase family protein [Leptospira santarosai]MDI7186887.1 histidine phosphatase family protein [Leptospira santarosai]MDI7199610.1 histidine phosphatase family protein [Leptospira santarosai]
MKNTLKKSNVLYVFRHGETDWNKEGRLQGHLEVPITAKGERQAKSIASILENKGVEILLSSDLKRAKKTSAIVSEILGLDPIFDSDFREVFLGEGQGKLISEVDFYFGKSFWEKWNNQDSAYDKLHFPNGESKQETDLRIRSSLIRITELFSDRVIALCTHGFVMTRMLKMYKSMTKNIENIQNTECIQFHFEEIMSKEKTIRDKKRLTTSGCIKMAPKIVSKIVKMEK